MDSETYRRLCTRAVEHIGLSLSLDRRGNWTIVKRSTAGLWQVHTTGLRALMHVVESSGELEGILAVLAKAKSFWWYSAGVGKGLPIDHIANPFYGTSSIEELAIRLDLMEGCTKWK